MLKEVYENEHTYVLYPTSKAIDLESLPAKLSSNEEKKSALHIIVLDGTWTQASSIFLNNPELKQLKQVTCYQATRLNANIFFLSFSPEIKVILNVDFVSEYTIRTQPRDFYLSTLETVALTLSKLENNPQVRTGNRFETQAKQA
jgi:DTW domain-containing protein YfiP